MEINLGPKSIPDLCSIKVLLINLIFKSLQFIFFSSKKTKSVKKFSFGISSFFETMPSTSLNTQDGNGHNNEAFSPGSGYVKTRIDP